jgi:hypothetical protein
VVTSSLRSAVGVIAWTLAVLFTTPAFAQQVLPPCSSGEFRCDCGCGCLVELPCSPRTRVSEAECLYRCNQCSPTPTCIASTPGAAPALYANPSYESPVRGEPGDLLLLAGTGFDASTFVIMEPVADTTQPPMLPHFIAGLPPVATSIHPQDPTSWIDANAVKVVLPESMTSGGASYALWAVQPDPSFPGHYDVSNRALINDARPAWVSPGARAVSPWAAGNQYPLGQEVFKVNGGETDVYIKIGTTHGFSDTDPAPGTGPFGHGVSYDQIVPPHGNIWQWVGVQKAASTWMYASAERPGVGRSVKVMGRNLQPAAGVGQTWLRFTATATTQAYTVAALPSCAAGDASPCSGATDCCSGVCNAGVCAPAQVQRYAAAVSLPPMTPGDYTITLSRDATSSMTGSWVDVPGGLTVLPDPPPTASSFYVKDYATAEMPCDPCDDLDDTLCITRAIQDAKHAFSSSVLVSPAAPVGAYVVFTSKLCPDATGNGVIPGVWRVDSNCFGVTDTDPATMESYVVCGGSGEYSGVVIPIGVNLVGCVADSDCATAFGSGTGQKGACTSVQTGAPCGTDQTCTAFDAGEGALAQCIGGLCQATLRPIVETEPAYDQPRPDSFGYFDQQCRPAGSPCYAPDVDAGADAGDPAAGGCECFVTNDGGVTTTPAATPLEVCIGQTCQQVPPIWWAPYLTQALFLLQGNNLLRGLHLRDNGVASGFAAAPIGGYVVATGSNITVADTFFDHMASGFTADVSATTPFALAPDGFVGTANTIVTGNTFGVFSLSVGFGLGEDTVVANNTFYPGGGGLTGRQDTNFQDAERLEVSSNVWNGTDTRYSYPYIGFGAGIFFEASTIQEEILVANNKMSGFGLYPLVEQQAINSGAIVFDSNGDGPQAQGIHASQQVVSATMSSVVAIQTNGIATVPDTPAGRWLQVDYGTGLGQVRKVTGFANLGSLFEISVTPPFDVAPTSGSRVIVAAQYWHAFVVDNLVDDSISMSGVPLELQTGSAGVINFYGSAADSTFESNTLIAASGLVIDATYVPVYETSGCIVDGGACTLNGGDCCSGRCIALLPGGGGNCVNFFGCMEPGQACGTDGDCCSNTCVYDGNYGGTVCARIAADYGHTVQYFNDIRGNTLTGQFGQQLGTQSAAWGNGIQLTGFVGPYQPGPVPGGVMPEWQGFGVSISGNAFNGAAFGNAGLEPNVEVASIVIASDMDALAEAPLYVDTLVFNNSIYGTPGFTQFPNAAAIANGFPSPGNVAAQANYPWGTLICGNQRDPNWKNLEVDAPIPQNSVLPPLVFTPKAETIRVCSCAEDGSPCATSAVCCSGLCGNSTCAVGD